MTWLKVCKYMYSLTSIDIRPFLDLKIEAGLISLYKNQEAVVEIIVLTHFLLERGRYWIWLVKKVVTERQ